MQRLQPDVGYWQYHPSRHMEHHWGICNIGAVVAYRCSMEGHWRLQILAGEDVSTTRYDSESAAVDAAMAYMRSHTFDETIELAALAM